MSCDEIKRIAETVHSLACRVEQLERDAQPITDCDECRLDMARAAKRDVLEELRHWASTGYIYEPEGRLRTKLGEMLANVEAKR